MIQDHFRPLLACFCYLLSIQNVDCLRAVYISVRAQLNSHRGLLERNRKEQTEVLLKGQIKSTLFWR